MRHTGSSFCASIMRLVWLSTSIPTSDLNPAKRIECRPELISGFVAHAGFSIEPKPP